MSRVSRRRPVACPCSPKHHRVIERYTTRSVDTEFGDMGGLPRLRVGCVNCGTIWSTEPWRDEPLPIGPGDQRRIAAARLGVSV